MKLFDTDDSDDEDIILENSLKLLYIGQIFQTWPDAECFLNDIGPTLGGLIVKVR